MTVYNKPFLNHHSWNCPLVLPLLFYIFCVPVAFLFLFFISLSYLSYLYYLCFDFFIDLFCLFSYFHHVLG